MFYALSSFKTFCVIFVLYFAISSHNRKIRGIFFLLLEMISETDTSLTSSEDFTTDEATLQNLVPEIPIPEEPICIEQYAQKVIDFSSQYGSDTSISYTAYNITGRPSKYPDYGDFPETFAMVSVYRNLI